MKNLNINDSFSDSEEDYIKSWVGHVPEEWYQKHPHFGYDVKGLWVEQQKDSVINKLLE